MVMKIFSRVIFVFSVLCVSLAFVLPSNAGAAATSAKKADKPATVDISNDVTSSYSADKSVQIGMIVKLKDKQPTTVEPLAPKDPGKILGVVIPNTNVTIVLTPQTVTEQQVLVATQGHIKVLVSNQNGPVAVGDYLTISAISGVAMKAGVDQDQVIGKASGAFTGTGDVISSISLKDTKGKETKVAIGRVAVDVAIAHNPLNQKTVDFVPAFMVSFAQTVANKSVSVARIYLSTVILVVSTIVTAIMLYSGIRSGMIAVGRNPLSRKSIIKSLIQTVIAGLIVFVAGIIAVYLLLKL